MISTFCISCLFFIVKNEENLLFDWNGERERVLTKKSKAFTLVEMLIVVVIIGILSAALLPRLQNMLAKSRDTKRVADLRNIAAAIEMYRSEYGVLPQYNSLLRCGTPVGQLRTDPQKLSAYLTNIPKDPQSSNVVKLHEAYYEGSIFSQVFQKGEYVYLLRNGKGRDAYGAAVLVAKVETPEYANYVYTKQVIQPRGQNNGGIGLWFGQQSDQTTIEDLILCDKVEKVKQGNSSQHATKTDKNCTYFSADQLYYVVKIE